MSKDSKHGPRAMPEQSGGPGVPHALAELNGELGSMRALADVANAGARLTASQKALIEAAQAVAPLARLTASQRALIEAAQAAAPLARLTAPQKAVIEAAAQAAAPPMEAIKAARVNAPLKEAKAARATAPPDVIIAAARVPKTVIEAAQVAAPPQAATVTIQAAGDPISSPPPSPTNPWETKLARARALSAELSAATDTLNAAIRDSEQALAALNLGVTASVDLYPEETSEEVWMQYLRFGKDATGWRLLLESGYEFDSGSWSVSPLLNASKEVRLKAVEKFPALLDKLIETAEEHLELVKKRVAEATTFTKKIKGAK
ncbi:hypothetical protein [Polyangium sp. y55x31]|uniref:hypothetical protein n=1 Tax=Polyangium sp. y55x31 TaxID=3042688 RepID=UPI0024823D4F|nr:hypothetical protein [Polyangium sp. y55x31]MDI1481181.1 hypothetical protein [Polyangium sp. y55x31]